MGFYEDRILVKEVLEGRPQAFEDLIRKYQKPIFYMVNRLLRCEEDSDEVTNKAFFQAYKHLGQFRFESSFKTWLSKIALNLARSQMGRWFRKTVELKEDISDGKSLEPMERNEHEEDKQWLQDALEELPPTQKEVIVLRIYEELPFKEVAAVVGSSEGTAKVNFHHGMKRLKEIYEKKRKKEL